MPSSPTPDGLKAEIEAGKMKVGNQIQASTGAPTTASVPLYTDSSSALAAGAIPFSFLLSPSSTSTSVLTVTGTSTLSADEIMHNTLVAGTGVTTWTKTGFIQVNIVDAGGNITDGKHYIQFGTLT